MTSKEERLALLKRLLSLYNDAYEEIAHLMVLEMGTTKAFSEVPGVGRHSASGSHYRSIRERILRGSSWKHINFKRTYWCMRSDHALELVMNQLVVKAAPALAAGCTMVAKPSEFSPLSSIKFAELVHQAGYPAGVYNHITGAGDSAGGALSRHPDVDMVSVTGST